MGFNEEFQGDLMININESEKIKLKLKGQGQMPMFIISTPTLTQMAQDPLEIIEEYQFLQKIFYFEMYKGITENEEDFVGNLEEQEYNLKEIKSFLTDLTSLTTESDYDSEKEIKKDLHFFRLMQSYVVINNNQDLPNISILEQQIQTEKFLQQLCFNSESCFILNQIYLNFTQQQKSYDATKPLNLKHFIIEHLPFQTRINILDMGRIYLNQFTKFSFKMEFLGPGKLIAAVRCEIKIPGLVVDMEILKG